MSGTYTSDEKVEYALKTALFRTMQSKDQPSSLEKSAPPRIFPKNIMKKNLIEKGEGDIDEDGYYVGRTNSNSAYYQNDNLVNLEEPELTITNYRIIDPSSNKISDKRVSDMTTVNMSQTSHNSINALPTTGTTYPLKNWFFRGHYGSHSGTAAFNAASSGYGGLQLAWDKSTVGATATEEDIVPHLKFYLQVQTNYTNVAHGDNITYGHDLMKGLIGLDQNFSTTIQVVQGQGGNCATLGSTGASTGDFWFTQATSGTLSFYGVTNKVNASASLSNLATTKFPMISYIRYTGETGFGAGSGGGGGSVAVEGEKIANTIIYRNVNTAIAALYYELENILGSTWPAGGNSATSVGYTNDRDYTRAGGYWSNSTDTNFTSGNFPYVNNSWNNSHHSRYYNIYMKAKANCSLYLAHANYTNFNGSNQHSVAVVTDLTNNNYTSVAFHTVKTHTGGGSNGSNWYYSASTAITLEKDIVYKLSIIVYYYNYKYYSGAGYSFGWQTSPSVTISGGHNTGSIKTASITGYSSITSWNTAMDTNDNIEFYSYKPTFSGEWGSIFGSLANANSSIQAGYNSNIDDNENYYHDMVINPKGGNVSIGGDHAGNFKLKINNSTDLNIAGSNAWHNQLCVQEETYAGSGITFKAGTQTGYIYYGSSTGNPWVGSGGMGFATTATSNETDIKMTIANNGNVGIGTTSPEERLDVGNGKICFSGNLHSGTEGGISYYHSGQSIERKILFFDSNGSTIIRAGDNSSSDGIKFQSYSGSDRMFIRDDGNVGIGTDGPSDRLHVKNGDIYIEEGKIQFAWPGGRADGSNANFGISIRHGSYELPIIHTEDPTVKGHLCFQPTNGYSDSSIIFKGYASTTTWDGTAGFGTERMRIQHNGNVGIGTNGAAGAKLHIRGTGEMIRLDSTDANGHAWIRFNNGGSERWYIGMGSSSTTTMYIYTYNSSHLALVHGGGSVAVGSDSQYQDAKLGINVGDEGTMLCSPDISQFLWRINSSAKWGIYWSTNGSGNNYYFSSDSNPNQILFIGNNAARACIDLDNGAIRTKDWYYIENSGDGIYWQAHGGGWNMTDNTWMRLYGDKRIYMSNGGLRIDACSSQDENSGIHLRGTYPTMWFRDYDNASFMIHINGGYFYILSGGTDTVTWSTVNSCWPFMIRRSDHAIQCGYNISAGNSWPVYRVQAFGGHLESEHGYEVLARNNSSKNGDWLYLDSYSNAPSGYHAQTCDGSNMYFNVQGYYVAYLNNGNVGRIDFTGQHRAISEDENLLKCVRNYVGLIVVSTGNINSLIRNEDTNVHEQLRGMKGIDINEAIPQVILSTSYKQKTVYGVIADGEDDEYYNSHERTTGKNMPDGQRPFQKNFPSQVGSDRTIKEFSWGAWGTVVQCEEEDDRLFINSVGEGGIWVCDEMGLIENGDYITSSNIPGYGCVQDDDLLHNYTVAKACMDCDFTLSWAGEKEKKQYKRGTWCVDKRRRADDSDTESECECDNIDEDHHYGEHYEPDCSNVPHAKDKHGMVYYPDAICHDPSGCCEMETCCDCSGNPIIEDYYFEDADYKCKEITHNGKTYRIAFIACTYHCG